MAMAGLLSIIPGRRAQGTLSYGGQTILLTSTDSFPTTNNKHNTTSHLAPRTSYYYVIVEMQPK